LKQDFQKIITNKISFLVFLGTIAGLGFSVGGCGVSQKSLSAIDENGTETATAAPGADSSPLESGSNSGGGVSILDASSHVLILNQAMTVRSEISGVLESQAELPVGAQVEVPADYSSKNLDYRDSNGAIVRSSTGFIYPIKVLSVPEANKTQFPQSKLDKINGVNGGLFIFASIVGVMQGVNGDFAALTAGSPGAGFVKNYNLNGQPKFNYLKSVTKRFAGKLNQGVDPKNLSAADLQKSQRIYAELKKVADRRVPTSKSYLMVDAAVAKKASLDYESSFIVAKNGAWSIAVGQTSVRHGFSNVPCAEFQSEIVREAYQRAGYRVSDDFNSSKGNTLIWSSTAAVVNFSMALYKGGWIPWDTTKYKPLTGSILMNGSGNSPGHTYISASDDGLFVVDNGAPQGRDLRKTSQSIIDMMFQTGVFFLPPGINPPLW
jgi:hypothetical protein